MKQTDWKIVYTSYSEETKRAINLITKEAGRNIIRQQGEYCLYVLPCIKEGGELPKNAFFISCYDDSSEIPKYVKREEVPEEGFLVKVVENPNDPEGRFVILTAHKKLELFYAAVSFLDDYIPANPPIQNVNPMPDLMFDEPLPLYSYSEVPDNKTRSIFTWGHSTNDFRLYIENMARLKFNELIIWNDYIPLNMDEIIDYAHSFGMKVILGYSWGWKEIAKRATSITAEDIEKVKEQAIREYREDYSVQNCDGIYFQSFTERKDNTVEQGKIAQLVTDMVNDVAEELWKITPDLKLVFGLHATSVRNELDIIEKVNPRIEILWEDCGDFPYNYERDIESEEAFEETIEFTKKLLKLRGGKGVGLAFKGVMMLNWGNFVYQPAPYVMGENSERTGAHDRAIRANGWRIYTSQWVKNGEYAAKMLKCINENKLDEIDMCMAGTFDGGIYFPLALCAQMFRKLEDNYDEMVKKVIRRDCISFD